MQNSIAHSSTPAGDSYEQIDMEGDATKEELAIEGFNRLISRLINRFRYLPQSGGVHLTWQTKGKGDNCHVSVAAKMDAVDHVGAVVRKKKPD